MNRNEIISVLVGMVLLLSVLGATVYLAHEKIVDGPAAVAILTSVVSLAGGAVAVHSGVSAGAKAANGNKP